MADLELKLACWDYDRTRPLIDGRVKPEGIKLNVEVLRPRQMFPRMLEHHEFDASEISLASHASLIGRGNSPFVGVPVMISKIFRHSCFYVRVGSLEKMLAEDRIDALISIYIPPSFLKGSPKIKRLFPDYKQAEKDYYAKTQIFPIMHTLALKKATWEQHPWIARSLYNAFEEARALALDELYDTDALRLGLPWLLHHVEELWQAFGDNWWSYGVDANRSTLTALGQYVYEQGISPRVVTPEEMYLPEFS